MKTFYDIHMHAFDLSHPNLSVFLQREDLIDVWWTAYGRLRYDWRFLSQA